MKFLVLQGPNLNLLGQRDTGHYGALTLAEIQQDLDQFARSNQVELVHIQSNLEGELVQAIHDAAAAQL